MTEGMRCKGIIHAVRKGDTLYKISRIYGVTVEQLMDANEDAEIYNLQIGMKLCVPIADRPRPDMGRPYTITAQDTLNSILKMFNLTFEEFEKLNPQIMPIELPENSIVYIPEDRILRDLNHMGG